MSGVVCINSENGYHSFAKKWWECFESYAPLIVYCEGPIGAGKTTCVRSLLRYQGVVGGIVSPTFSLNEQYCFAGKHACHIDLYRLKDPAELIHCDLVDEILASDVAWIEWPSLGQPYLPPANLIMNWSIHADGCRQIQFTGLLQSHWTDSITHF